MNSADALRQIADYIEGLVADAKNKNARIDALENALREILDYGGAAESALHDEYVVDRAQTALAPEQDK